MQVGWHFYKKSLQAHAWSWGRPEGGLRPAGSGRLAVPTPSVPVRRSGKELEAHGKGQSLHSWVVASLPFRCAERPFAHLCGGTVPGSWQLPGCTVPLVSEPRTSSSAPEAQPRDSLAGGPEPSEHTLGSVAGPGGGWAMCGHTWGLGGARSRPGGSYPEVAWGAVAAGRAPASRYLVPLVGRAQGSACQATGTLPHARVCTAALRPGGGSLQLRNCLSLDFKPNLHFLRAVERCQAPPYTHTPHITHTHITPYTTHHTSHTTHTHTHVPHTSHHTCLTPHTPHHTHTHHTIHHTHT
uniref:Uncharacterized protein n=1 Tax=Myotis myotis TaxID=51298 RepID=A0A7J7RCF0_MYOMY|nr:hypothetical protein mMyoMyo1_010839 [Myotis myotis]